ncbi:MAG: cytochrome c oxidase subunit II [Cyclobacteriaceae bacterium]|nr:cytochrome c oxidase subunit II [Cyclobacteriaceae bacterium]
MMSLIIGLGVILVLGILYMIFRIGSLVSLVKDSKEGEHPGNDTHGFLFLVFLVLGLGLFGWYSYTHYDSYVLPIASEHGVQTDDLFWITMWISVVAFVALSIVMFWFAYKYRYNANRRATFFPDSAKLEIVWTVIPAVVLALLIFKGLRVWGEITSPASADAEVIEVIGQQFAWTARYPGVKDKQLGEVNYKLIDAVNEFGLDLTDKNSFDDFKALELHIPKGKEVHLKIRAKDVIHSVFLPHFRVKMDAVPGMYTNFKFVPTKSTQDMRNETGNPDFNYEMACTEVCGAGHFSMRFLVVVDEPEDFEKWKAAQEPWLKQNPDYLAKVPAALKEVAMIKSGIPIESGAGVGATSQTVSISN